jgi:GT2 family glycosyltransferase
MHCTGDLIAFLDSDDMWIEDNLESQVKALTENLELGFCFASSFDIFGHEDNLNLVSSNSIVAKEFIGKNHFRDLLWGNYIYISGFIFRANLLEKVGLFDNNFVHAEDYDFILRIAKYYDGANVGSILYRIHEFNLSKFQFHESHIEVLQILRSNRDTRSSRIIETMILFRYFEGSLIRRELKRFFESEKIGFVFLAKITIGATIHSISALKRHINRFISVLR